MLKAFGYSDTASRYGNTSDLPTYVGNGNMLPPPDDGLLQQVLLGVRAVQASQIRLEHQLSRVIATKTTTFVAGAAGHSVDYEDGTPAEYLSHGAVADCSPVNSHNSAGWVNQTGRTGILTSRGVKSSQNNAAFRGNISDGNSEHSHLAHSPGPGNHHNHHGPSSHTSGGSTLAQHWPGTINVRPQLHEQKAGDPEDLATVIGRIGIQNNIYKRRSGSSQSFSSLAAGESDLHEKLKKKFRIPVFNPNATWRTVIELLGIIVLQYDLVVSPFLISWFIEVEGWLLAVQWCAALFWVLMLLMDLNTAIYTRGDIISKQPHVAKHYLRHRFGMDLVLLFVDWINLAIDTASAQSKGSLMNYQEGLLFQVGKGSRLIKVVRLWRLNHILDAVLAGKESEQFRFVMMAIKITFVTLLVTHILTCVWYWIGTDAPTDTGYRWLDIPAGVDGSQMLSNSSTLYQYLTSFHWTIGQLTLGGAEGLTPMSSRERLFSIGLLILGLIFCSTIVSFFSAQIIQLVMIKQEQTNSLLHLRKYLRQHNVSGSMHLRVMAQVFNRFEQETPLTEGDVSALALLAPTLRMQLVYETRVPHLLTHPFFNIWAEVDMTAVQALAIEAVDHRYLANEDELFLPETDSRQAFYLIKGKLIYVQMPDTARVRDRTETSVHPGAWISEAALWSHWTHVGSMIAEKASHLLCLNADSLFKVIQDHTTIRQMTSMYGKNFHARVLSAVPPHSPWPSDLKIPFTEDVASLLSQHVGIGLLRRALNNNMLALSPEDEKYLVSELKSDRCTVQYTPDGGHLERVVSVTNILLRQHDGSCLFQIGTYDATKGCRVSCHVPGCKRKGGETPGLALERLLRDEFKQFADRICIEGNETVVSVKEQTQNLRMRTKTAKTIYKASLTVAVEELLLPAAGLKQERLASVPEVRHQLGHLMDRQVLVLTQGGSKAGLYAFFQEEDYEILDAFADENPQVVSSWLQCLDIPNASAPAGGASLHEG